MLLRKDKYTPQAGRAGSWETESVEGGRMSDGQLLLL